jgi:NAD+-processing family protein with receiver domain
MKIWLDDIRPAPDGWTWMKNATRVMTLIESAAWNVGRSGSDITHISLDHDLGENVETGYDVMAFIEEMVVLHDYKLPVITIHSANPVGRANIQRVIDAITKRQHDKSC